MKKRAQIHKALTIFAYTVMLTGMTLLLAVVFRYPQNHLIPQRMIPGGGHMCHRLIGSRCVME